MAVGDPHVDELEGGGGSLLDEGLDDLGDVPLVFEVTELFQEDLHGGLSIGGGAELLGGVVGQGSLVGGDAEAGVLGESLADLEGGDDLGLFVEALLEEIVLELCGELLHFLGVQFGISPQEVNHTEHITSVRLTSGLDGLLERRASKEQNTKEDGFHLFDIIKSTKIPKC